MSTADQGITRRNAEGVLLHYYPGRRHPHHASRKPQRSDLERIAVLKAEKELIVLEIIVQHLDLSDIATERIDQVMHSIRHAFSLMRKNMGMSI